TGGAAGGGVGAAAGAATTIGGGGAGAGIGAGVVATGVGAASGCSGMNFTAFPSAVEPFLENIGFELVYLIWMTASAPSLAALARRSSSRSSREDFLGNIEV